MGVLMPSAPWLSQKSNCLRHAHKGDFQNFGHICSFMHYYSFPTKPAAVHVTLTVVTNVHALKNHSSDVKSILMSYHDEIL